jgi:DnaJ-class molecular chaperone
MVKCPFCGEDDFDLIGLKGHFDAGDCDVFNSTKVPFRMYSRKNAQQEAAVDLQTATNTQSAGEAPQICPTCKGSGEEFITGPHNIQRRSCTWCKGSGKLRAL